ncbi:PREDICTED: uncharacterized protein LOC107328869, partial [Acropora digitifera]|uniref:uncharacterized protein LOC107328869 n=1 Tax=Acropora digitifera TaxID=70779 RepID=UPI00077A3E95
VCDEKFFMVGFMSYYNLPDEGYLPCELGAVEYSLNGGILRRLHYFIPPGELKVGLRYAAMSTSERTHQIPIEGLAKKGDTYRKIWLELLRFVNPEQTAIFPPVYCRISETKQTEFCLQYLSKKAGLWLFVSVAIKVYGIPLTPSHLPERPEGAFGTAIHAPEISWSTQKERHSRDKGQSMEDNRAFAPRDYYCNGGATALGIRFPDICILTMNIYEREAKYLYMRSETIASILLIIEKLLNIRKGLVSKVTLCGAALILK